MAYYFMVEKKKGEYEPLDIEKILCLGSKRQYTKKAAFALQEIDMFTTMFDDEKELRKTLVLGEVLPLSYADKALSIRWVKKGKYNKVPYDFLYQKDLEYLVDPSKLVELIMRRFLQKDFVFVKKFAEYFAGYRECASTAADVRMYADISIREDSCYRHFYDVDKNGDNMIKRLVKLLLIEHYEKDDGYIVYSKKVNYRNLHTMVAFVNNYDNKHQKINEEEIISQMLEGDSSLESADNQELETGFKKPKAKKRIREKEKKKREIPGQVAFDDLD